jgi:hypothetical protein
MLVSYILSSKRLSKTIEITSEGEPLFTLRPPFGKLNAGVRGRAHCGARITYTATLWHVSQDVQVQT